MWCCSFSSRGPEDAINRCALLEDHVRSPVGLRGTNKLVGRVEKLSLLSSVVMCADILSVFSFLVVEYQISVLMVPPWRSGQAVRANRPIKT
jgi:hypothetical protein